MRSVIVRRRLAAMAVAALLLGLLPLTAAGAQEEAENWDNFTQEVLNEDVQEAMSLAVLPDGRVLHNARSNNPSANTSTSPFRLYDPDTGESPVIAQLPVYSFSEYGAQGIALDPNFEDNNWIYVYYTPPHPDVPSGEAPHNSEDPSAWDAYQGANYLSRFDFVDGDEPTIDLDSEQVLLEVPQNLGLCCHLGGDIDFDSDGNLYLSTGDDTSPFQSNNYTPIDERPTRNPGFDAQRTSANTASLSGKLLRITPTADGSYTVPEDNMFNSGEYNDLFPGGEYDPEVARPEIWAMGFRNPFRFSIDQETDIVYLADYGPDAGADNPNRGPRATTSWHILAEPANIGWPYCIGNNFPFVEYDFATGTSGDPFDCDNPVNNSPRNTGLTQLPPTRAADVWNFNSGVTPEFPELGGGGGAPMGGPVYRYDAALDSDVKFPEYYDGIPLFYEWNQDYIKQFVVDESGTSLEEIRDFLPGMQFFAPMDMEFGPDGALYLLEYGGGFFQENVNAKLSRIIYEGDTSGEMCPNVGIPADQISVQLWTFNGQANMNSVAGLTNLLDSLQGMGYRTIEPFGQPYGFISAEDFRDLAGDRGIQVVSSHGSQNVGSFPNTVAYAATLGQDYIGAGGPPGNFNTFAGTMQMADTLNTLGEMAVDGGIPGGILVHNHQNEFLTTHVDPDDGETKSVWQLLYENTDPEYVTFQLDVYWAAIGGYAPEEVIEEYGDRITSLHVKDGNIANNQQTFLGEGDLDFEAIFAAAEENVDYYMVEADGPADAYAYTEHAFQFLNCFGSDGPPDPDPDPEPGDLICPAGLSDDFSGDVVHPRWSETVREDTSGYSIGGGNLTVDVTATDIYGTNNTGTPNIFLQPIPDPGEAWEATLEVTIEAYHAYQQAGLIVYGDDDNYAKMVLQGRDTSGDNPETRIFQFIREEAAQPNEVDASNTSSLGADYPDTVWVRFTSDGSNLQAWYSADGEDFTAMPQTKQMAGIDNPRIGLIAVSGAGQPETTADFENFMFSPDEVGERPELHSDDFEGDALDGCRWDRVVRYNDEDVEVSDGQLLLETAVGDIYGADNTDPDNLILQTQPEGDWTIETHFNEELDGGYAQAGLLAYVDDDNYVKFDVIADINETDVNRIELRSEVGSTIQNPQPNIQGAALPDNDGEWWLRLTKTGDSFAGSVSVDGETWIDMPDAVANTQVAAEGAVGLFAIAPEAITSTVAFDYFHVLSEQQDPEPEFELELTAAPRCIAGSAFVVVTAHNDVGAPLDVEFASDYGTRAFSGVASDRFASHAFNTRTADLDGGSVTVSASGEVDGEEVSGEWTVDFDGLTC